jgi:hypothetical protein
MQTESYLQHERRNAVFFGFICGLRELVHPQLRDQLLIVGANSGCQRNSLHENEIRFTAASLKIHQMRCKLKKGVIALPLLPISGDRGTIKAFVPERYQRLQINCQSMPDVVPSWDHR